MQIDDVMRLKSDHVKLKNMFSANDRLLLNLKYTFQKMKHNDMNSNLDLETKLCYSSYISEDKYKDKLIFKEIFNLICFKTVI